MFGAHQPRYLVAKDHNHCQDGSINIVNAVGVGFKRTKVIDCIALALLALMVQAEAGSEPFEGKLAVAYVAVNRAEASSGLSHPLQMVLTQPKQFKINPRLPVSEASMLAARMALFHQQPDPTHGADHFYAHGVKPYPPWYDEKYMTVRIGNHTFLKLGGF